MRFLAAAGRFPLYWMVGISTPRAWRQTAGWEFQRQ